MSQNVYQRIGKHLRAYRKSAGMTQEKLAEKANISVHHLGFIERGKAKPTLDTLARIAAAVGIAVEDLFRFPSPNRRDPKQLLEQLVDLLRRRRPEELRLFLTLIQEITSTFPAASAKKS